MESERTMNDQCGVEVGGLMSNNGVKGGIQDIMVQ
jgi:hypothetical protein